MNTDFKNHEQNELTDRIIKIFYKVYNKIGYGFLEKVYVNAMMIEFERAGINTTAQPPIRVLYEKEIVGEYFADILVDEKVIVEIKASRSLTQDNEAQLLNYLKATDVEVGLLLNFGPKAELKRKLFDNFGKK